MVRINLTFTIAMVTEMAVETDLNRNFKVTDFETNSRHLARKEPIQSVQILRVCGLNNVYSSTVFCA